MSEVLHGQSSVYKSEDPTATGVEPQLPLNHLCDSLMLLWPASLLRRHYRCFWQLCLLVSDLDLCIPSFIRDDVFFHILLLYCALGEAW